MHQCAAPLLARLIVPPEGFRWLASEREVLTAWLTVISGMPEDVGPLGQIIEEADRLSTAADLTGGITCQTPTARVRPVMPAPSSPRPPESPEPPSESPEPLAAVAAPPSPVATVTEAPALGTSMDLGQAFLAWLKQELASGALPINTVNSRVHRVREGVLLVSRDLSGLWECGAGPLG